MTWAREFFHSNEYLESARRRVMAGRASHLESYWLPRLLGKPPDNLTVSGDAKRPIRLVVMCDDN